MRYRYNSVINSFMVELNLLKKTMQSNLYILKQTMKVEQVLEMYVRKANSKSARGLNVATHVTNGQM